MKICKICKTSNEEQFVYCKNCGYKFQEYHREQLHQVYVPQPDYSGLVPISMELPDPFNPGQMSVQTVYVTPAQKAAILYDQSMRGMSQN